MDTYPRILIAVLATLALLGGCGPVGPTQEPALDGSTAQGAPVGAEQGAEARATNVEPIQVPSPKVGGGAVPSNKNSLDGHDPRVAGLAFLEGGDRLASAGCIFSLKLWDVTSGQEMGSPVVLGGRAYALSFSPDGGLVAVGDAQKRIQLWDVKTGQQRGSLRGHGTYVMSLTFSPDGRLLASAGDDNSIKIWDIESGQEIHDLMGHITPVTALAFSPDGSLLASGSVQFSTTIMLWDVASGEARRTLVDHTDNINDLAFSPDGTLLASASADRTARIWRVKSGQVLHTLTGQSDPVYALAFSPDGTLLATSGDDGGIRLWDVKAGQEIRTLGGHNESVFYLVFSPDGSRLASGGVDGTVLLRVLGAAEEAEPVALQRPVPQAASPVPVSDRSLSKGQAQGTIAFASYREGESKIFLMNVDGSNVTPVSRTGLRESRPAWSPDGSRIAYVRRMNNANHEIYVMNADGSGATQLTNRPDSVESEPSWSPDGQRIAFISNERPTANTLVGRFHVWVMNADGSDQMLLTDIGGSNTSPDWSPDGQRLVFDSTRDGDHEIYVMDANGGHLVNLTQHPAMDYSPTWSPDGTRIAFVSDRHGDEEIYVMGADGSDPVRLTDHPGFDKAPTWSPDGQYLAFYSRRVAFNTEVYRMRADGTEQVRLTDDADFDGFPVWQPSAAVAGLQVAEGSAPFETDTGLDSQASLASLSALEGLPPDQFFEESFELLMLRDPEWVSSEGLAGHFGTGHSQLTDLSDAYRRETQQMQAAILDMLRAYDREQLGREQQISYDIYEWYLDDQVRGQEFMYHDFPVTHFVTGVQHQLIQLFTDLHPIASRQDAEEYVARLEQVDGKFEGLVEGLQLRANTGVILPEYIFPWLMRDISGIAHGQPRHTPFYASFEEKLKALEDLTPDERQALLQGAERAIEGSVIPAFAALEEALQALRLEAPAHTGAWQYPNGRAYYDHILRHHTTTDMTADEIHELGLKELARIQAEMRAVFDELGYPQDESLSELYARVAREGGTVSGNQAAGTYEAIIQEAEGNLDDAFDIRPQADVVVIAGNEGDYYVSASLDGSRPGAFYARVGGSKERYAMPTLAYHEAVPGHHFQIAIAQESDLPLFRNVLGFTGYAEGWALYAEQLAYDLGWYEDDPYGNLGRLRDQAFRAARLVVDTGLHAKGWTFDQAHQFMVENVGRDPGYLEFEITRYITWPGQATAYMVGMLQIMELRQRAMDSLGNQFDLKEFHQVVLSNGSMPLEVLEQVVDDYIEDRAAAGAPPDSVTVGLFSGNGAASACVTAAERMFKWMGHDVERLYAQTINYDNLDRIDVFYFPGGSAGPFQEDITAEGKKKLRQRIANGACYIGTCAGALFAAEQVIWEGRVDPRETLRLFPGTAQGPIPQIYADPEIGMCQVDLAPHAITGGKPEPASILYYNGPYFAPNTGAEVDVVGRYEITGEPALVAGAYGLGRWFLTGPHPEWEEDDDRDGVAFFDDFEDQGSDWDLMKAATLWCLGRKN